MLHFNVKYNTTQHQLIQYNTILYHTNHSKFFLKFDNIVMHAIFNIKVFTVPYEGPVLFKNFLIAVLQFPKILFFDSFTVCLTDERR